MILNSLLSLYITANISPAFNAGNFISNQTNETNIIRAASFDFSKLAKSKTTPIKNPQYISPIIKAVGSIAIDLETGAILYEKNANRKMAIASITKLMTVLIILEESSLNDLTTISSNAANTEGSTMFLRTGEIIAIENLVYGALINSANDAAVALAEHNAGSVSEFVEKMNKKAKLLGLLNTNFANPIGLDSPNNYSSAYDVAKMGQYIYQKHEFIRHAASLKELEVKSESEKYIHKLKTTNDLLDSYLNIKGLKTGHTELAGLCLISVAENEAGNKIITVVLNSPARFTETKVLIDWIYRAFTW